MDNLQRTRTEMYESFDKIREIETSLKRIDQDYKQIYSASNRIGKYLGR